MKHSNKRDPDFGALGLGKYLKNNSRLARDVKVQARIDREIARVKSQKRAARYVIFGHEHQAFWGPGRSGYVQDLAQAGRYSRADGIDICRNAIPGQSKAGMVPPEMPIAVADLVADFALVADLGAIGNKGPA